MKCELDGTNGDRGSQVREKVKQHSCTFFLVVVGPDTIVLPGTNGSELAQQFHQLTVLFLQEEVGIRKIFYRFGDLDTLDSTLLTVCLKDN